MMVRAESIALDEGVAYENFIHGSLLLPLLQITVAIRADKQ